MGADLTTLLRAGRAAAPLSPGAAAGALHQFCHFLHSFLCDPVQGPATQRRGWECWSGRAQWCRRCACATVPGGACLAASTRPLRDCRVSLAHHAPHPTPDGLQGLLVKTAKYGWRTAWKTLMTELAPQVPAAMACSDLGSSNFEAGGPAGMWPPSGAGISVPANPALRPAAEQGWRVPAATVQLPGADRQPRLPAGARQARTRLPVITRCLPAASMLFWPCCCGGTQGSAPSGGCSPPSLLPCLQPTEGAASSSGKLFFFFHHLSSWHS